MYKRSGVWWTCIRYKGKKIQKSLETSDKKLAKAIEGKVRAEIVEGKYFERAKGDNFTVRDLIKKYMEEHSKPNKAPRTYQDDIYFSKRILKHFGKKTLLELTPRHISAYIKKMRGEGVGDTMINHELRLLRHAYNLAIKEWELVDTTPFAKVSIPKGNNKRVRYLSKEEEKMLLANLPDWLRPIVIIARETGLRLSNIANLTWTQVNLFSKMIIIERTKNGNPIGIPMTKNVFDTLKALSKVRRIDSDFIFGKKGKPFRRWWISKSFKRVCEKAGIENFRFHDLRHDFCSRLVQRGVDLYTVAALAGHKDISTTQRYAHLSPEKLKSAVEMLNSDYNLTTVEEKGLTWSR
jgi:site-specific recombinase XerD|tara:strand:+ start:1318 stop:2370 length:1053 start_codon:yes stop_codon:yes gene_type:complete